MKPKLIIITAILWLCPQGFAASEVTQKYATVSTTAANGSPVMVAVSSVQSPPFICDETCTTVNYSFCLDETPGCLEGWTEVAYSAFTGNVGTSLAGPNSVTLNAGMVAGDMYGNSYYCYAWDSDGNCTDEEAALNCGQASCPEIFGTIALTFTKVPYSATIATDVNPGLGILGLGVSLPAYNESISEQFSSVATGTVIGIDVTSALDQGVMGFYEITDTALPTTTSCSACFATTSGAAPPLSTVLAKSGRVSEKALRRLRVLERAQKAYIAQRKGDDLTDKR